MMHRRAGNGTSNGGGECNGHCCEASTTNGHHHQARPPRRVKKSSSTKKKIRNEAFTKYYGPDWETEVQMCLLCTLSLMAGFYAFYKLAIGGGAVDGGGVMGGVIKGFFAPKIIYEIPGSMEKIGEKSVPYQLLRQEYDQIYPLDAERSLGVVKELHKRQYNPIPIPQPHYYDVHNCPDEPPEGYPFAWNIMDVLNHWSPDDPTPHTDIHQGLCVFDFATEHDKALKYRQQELPFVVRGDPQVAATVERWSDSVYMEKLMGTVLHRTEYSPNNHFMYWMKPNISPAQLARQRERARERPVRKFGGYHVEAPPNWTQPTEMLRMAYTEWLEHANVTDDQLGPDKPHWYYRLIGCGDMGRGNCDKGSSEYLFDELTFFQPKDGLYMVEPQKQKGIHCRFGMKGVIAENHFDGSRNAIVVLNGERRYMLSHPDQCELLSLFPKEHPSARHSAVDWSNPDLEMFPDFAHAATNEVVLQAGDVLYLPTNWFHYIVSLDLNFQCNTRSGLNTEYMPPINQCGF